ncbi:MAG: hypothetical protein AUK35_09685 [Zetaproteobacteria bacterium CG2_30_46_52]|nr:MAG: hypothetical protein AUK35_09685 [Zetaproteobacteria bacterium CG2_30_46_52]
MKRNQPHNAQYSHQQIDVGVVVCSIDVSALAIDSNRQRIHLIPVNEEAQVVGLDGRAWKYNAANVLDNAKTYPVRIPGDYHHASINADKTGAKAPASGWIEPSSITAEANGIWAEVEWTSDAANAIRKKEYRYISPVFSVNKSTNEIYALKGFALTHYPNLGDLTPVANAQYMEESQMDELLERFKYMLNLPELATPEEILAELEKAIARLKAMSSESPDAANTQDQNLIVLMDKLELQLTTLSANAQQDLTAFVPRSEFDTVRDQLFIITSENESKRVDAQVNAALAKGVIAPTSKNWAANYCRKDPEGFKDFVANAAKAVPLGEEKHPHTAANALTAEEVAMCAQLDINHDDFKKTKAMGVNHGIN